MTRLLLVAAALVVWIAAAGVGAGAEWDVYPGGLIQATVNAASTGDTIYVHAGTYVENVDVNKSITLIGDGADVVTVRAADASDHVFEVTADYVNISGFAAMEATERWGESAGICLNGISHCKISDNNISNNVYGIDLHCSTSNQLTNNHAANNDYGIYVQHVIIMEPEQVREYFNNSIDTSNTVNGKSVYYYFDKKDVVVDGLHTAHLTLAYSSNLTIRNCDVSMGDGIYFYKSNNTTIINNIANMNNNSGIKLRYSNNNIVIDNILNSNGGSGIDVLYASSNNILSNNSVLSNSNRGIWLHHSNNNSVSHNNINNSSVGIDLMSSDHNIVIDNNVKLNNYYGIEAYYSNNNTITNNTAVNNEHGIYLVCSSKNNTISHNNIISNNEYGIWLWNSYNNDIYLNNFINNSKNIVSYGFSTNHWNPNSPITYTYNGKTHTNYLGNYWDDYTDIDIDNDGIWDNPYAIDSNGDRYPLVGRFENYIDLGYGTGDLNSDGTLTPADAVIALRIAAGGGSASCDPTTLTAADVSGDDRVTSLDALMILQAAAGGIAL
jgi:parallel beta-helix repeat protein